MDFSEKLIEALNELGIKNYVIFGTGPDKEGFALADGSHDKIMGNIVGVPWRFQKLNPSCAMLFGNSTRIVKIGP